LYALRGAKDDLCFLILPYVSRGDKQILVTWLPAMESEYRPLTTELFAEWCIDSDLESLGYLP
jgi:hypothetical protein